MAIDYEGKPLPDELKLDNLRNWEQMFQMIDDVERWKDWEEVPDEDLWEDGEIDENGLTLKLFQQIITEGEWKVIRRTNDTID